MEGNPEGLVYVGQRRVMRRRGQHPRISTPTTERRCEQMRPAGKWRKRASASQKTEQILASEHSDRTSIFVNEQSIGINEGGNGIPHRSS